MMRSGILLSLALLTTVFATAPTADAAMQVCTVATSPGACNGWVCADLNGSGSWSGNECVGKDDAEVDPCQFQSDCCSTVSGFWCPERQ